METGGISQSQSFSYLVHPMMVKKGMTTLELKKQETLSVALANLLLTVKTEIKFLEENLKLSANGNVLSYHERLAILKKGEERYDKPKLLDHIQYLYDMITAKPQILGDDAFKRAAFLNAEYLEYKSTYH